MKPLTAAEQAELAKCALWLNGVQLGLFQASSSDYSARYSRYIELSTRDQKARWEAIHAARRCKEVAK